MDTHANDGWHSLAYGIASEILHELEQRGLLIWSEQAADVSYERGGKMVRAAYIPASGDWYNTADELAHKAAAGFEAGELRHRILRTVEDEVEDGSHSQDDWE